MPEKKAKLTEEELAILKKDYRSPFITAFTFCVFIGFALHLYIFNVENHSDIIILEVIYIIVVVLIWSITRLRTKKLRNDIKNGYKDLITRNITEKKVIVQESQRLGPPRQHYFLYFDNYSHIVEIELFDRASIGDEIIFHSSPQSGNLISLEFKKI